ncbi:DNA-binding transcriptional regulator Fis [Pistricoccus aurantiacus]|uniref:Putative Fis-like DNA-binding protein n=1 Tax=Pistricoccus aurantiacus TaxID=1883414 RepID=A0A5B8SUC9_9GAMM|nr:DNA-binding transcriptional regulator Fis [Pistricoccus aurantiacus]QEA40326.1 DNA-binding transcriptional regulator Fis [Pistricoccus aurantiacus]
MTTRQAITSSPIAAETLGTDPLDRDVSSSPSLTSRELLDQQRPLREAVDTAMRRYFTHLDGSTTTDLYAMVMAEVEAPLLAAVMEHTQGNQTRAAEMLGLNRGTLRKKLKFYELI